MTIQTSLGLTEWAAGQDNPHIVVNEADAASLVLHLTLKGKGTSTPPGSPAEGDAYIIGASPTGAWSTFTQDNIAYYHNGSWREMTAVNNLTLTADDGSGGTLQWRYVSGTGWTQVTIEDPDTLKKNETATLTAGYAQTSHNAGTISSGTFTPDESNGSMQRYINGGAHTLAPPVRDTSIHIQMTNNASAGALTTSGFTVVTGDALTITDGEDFFLVITRNNGFSHLHVVALQ